MTRRARHRAIYWLVVLGGALALFGVAVALSTFFGDLPIAVVLVLLTAAPAASGGLANFLKRDLIIGLRSQKRKDHAAAKVHFERFIGLMHRAPWLKHLIWLRRATYSSDPEVLALDHLGLVEMALGEFEAARTHFETAIELDAENPLPFHCLGLLCVHTGDIDEGLARLEKARALGFRDDASDKIINAFEALSYVPPASGPFGVEILNDHVTPMEFVVDILREEFDCTQARATGIMLTVHGKGSFLCGRYGEAEARARMERAVARAHAAHHPLMFRIVGPGPDEPVTQ
jgi:ATP-dependent Clp protease adaptor protein ClpS